jgi:hypothetical protein
MLSRGFSGTIYYVKRDRLQKADFVCLFVTGVVLILFRAYDLVNLIGRQAERMF